MSTTIESTSKSPMKKPAARHDAVVLREYGPFGARVHGVTHDGKNVWLSTDDAIVGFDPASGDVVRRLPVVGSAGTAFDGENLYQIAAEEILVVRPSDGVVLRRMPAPEKASNSGLAYAGGFLWVGQYEEGRIVKIDAKTGEVVKTLRSDRWVTGVSFVEGEGTDASEAGLWHATHTPDGDRAEIRRLGADGAVEETLVLPEGIHVSGLEADRRGRFFGGGGRSGMVRLIGRKD